MVFSATGTIQTYVVPAGGTYRIEAAGAQGGASSEPGGKGGIVSGMFFLRRGEKLCIVAGRQGTPTALSDLRVGHRGGSSLVWIGDTVLPNPIKLMLSARGGPGGSTPPDSAGIPPVHAADWRELTLCNKEMDTPTADALVTQWTQTVHPGEQSPKEAGRNDRAGYNAGAFRQSRPAAHEGNGYVSVTPVRVTEPTPVADATSVPVPPPTSPAGEVPTVGALPAVTPRPSPTGNPLRRQPGAS